MSCASTSLELSAGGGGGNRDETHTLKLKPFMVDMLDVIAVQGPAGGVECWMDIQRGVFPNVSSGDVVHTNPCKYCTRKLSKFHFYVSITDNSLKGIY